MTESIDTNGNKTTTTDRTIHRKGDYERNATYEAQLKHKEEIISLMQHKIDSLALSNSINAGTHWAKKDSTNIVNEQNTKDIKPESRMKGFVLNMIIVMAVFIGAWLYIIWKDSKITHHE